MTKFPVLGRLGWDRGSDHRLERAAACVVSTAVACLVALGLVGHGAQATLPMMAIAYVACLVAVARRGARDELGRASWRFLTLALVAAAIGTVYYKLEVENNPDASWPNLSHLGRAIFVMSVNLALMIKLRARLQHLTPGMLLDGAIVVAGAFAVGTQFLYPVLMDVTNGDIRAAVTVMLYPVGDLLLISTALVGIAVLGRHVDAQWLLFSLGIVALGVSDIFFVTSPTMEAGGLSSFLCDLLQLTGLALATWAVASDFVPNPERLSRDDRHRRILHSNADLVVFVLPVLTAVAGLTLLTPVGGWHASTGAQWLATLALVLIAARTLATLTSVRALAAARMEAGTDPLTQLLNRRGLSTATAEWFQGDDVAPAALIVCNLDDFKAVNHTYGDTAGDEMLVETAHRLTALAYEDATVARLGADEFAVFVPDARKRDLKQIVTSLAEVTSDPFYVGGGRIDAAMSLGVALAPAHGVSLAGLLRSADTALSHAKLTAAPYAVFDPNTTSGLQNHAQTSELRKAVQQDELVVFYQPKIELTGNRLIGAEALVRWNHPTQGLLTPDKFLPAMEQAGLMSALTDVVLSKSLEQLAQWRADGYDLSVAVNLPPSSVLDPTLPDRLTARLALHKLAPESLTLEITEESLLDDRSRAREVLSQIRERGIKIAIDDYGSGYSSLAYLRELPVDELKLDRSFVMPMTDDERSRKIVQSTVNLAHSLGLMMVAEGVETAEGARQLADFGCDAAQGFHYSRPVPATEFVNLLTTATAVPRQRRGDLALAE